MIAALISEDGDTSGKQSVLLILEPANFEKLRLGQTLIKSLNDFIPNLSPAITVMLTYTPDIVWLGEQLAGGADLGAAIKASLHRPEVYSRTLDPEALRKQEIRAK